MTIPTMNKEEFASMQSELESLDSQREELIAIARRVQHAAKKGLYQAQREEFDIAKQTFADSQEDVDKLLIADKKQPRVGAVTASLQEWGECFSFYIVVSENRLPSKEELGLSTTDFLLALADLAGEITRRAVLLSINKEVERVKDLRLFLDELLGLFLSFNFRNGELRKKTDQVRWNMQKIEELLSKTV